MRVIVVYKDPPARPHYLSKKQTPRHALQASSYVAFQVISTNLFAVGDDYRLCRCSSGASSHAAVSRWMPLASPGASAPSKLGDSISFALTHCPC